MLLCYPLSCGQSAHEDLRSARLPGAAASTFGYSFLQNRPCNLRLPKKLLSMLSPMQLKAATQGFLWATRDGDCRSPGRPVG